MMMKGIPNPVGDVVEIYSSEEFALYFRRIPLGANNMKDGVAISEGGIQFRFKGCDERIYSDTQFPETVLLSTIGKSPLDIIQGHPDIDARYTAEDRIVAARWYPDAEVTGFDVVRAR